MSVKVKICGITSVEDAKLAEQYGADFIGLNFSKTSPRCISIKVASEIIANVQKAVIVGVFVEQAADEVISISKQLALPMVQVYQAITLDNISVIQGLQIADANDAEQILRIESDFILCDAKQKGRVGGHGIKFNWDLLPKNLSKVFLAGGINVENAKQACQLKPYAIDVCSGVESSPGHKDQQKLQRLLQEVQHAR